MGCCKTDLLQFILGFSMQIHTQYFWGDKLQLTFSGRFRRGKTVRIVQLRENLHIKFFYLMQFLVNLGLQI